MKTFSIIIPVFNTSKYLEQCIDSIIYQSVNDFEIILVNDGSTDNSGVICNYYSQKYSFIKVIHKENGGLSDARNTGLLYAEGDYILFIDSDDYIFRDSIAEIKKTLNEKPDVDVIFLNAYKVYDNGKKIPLGDNYDKKRIYNKSHENVLEHIANLPKFPGSACTKLVKRSLIENNNLYFEKNLLAEDIDWTVKLLLSAKTFNYCEANYYFYRQGRKGSITNTKNDNLFYSLLYIIKKWSIPLNQSTNRFQKYINAFMAYEYVILLHLYGKLSRAKKSIFFDDIKSYSWLLKESKIRTVKIVDLLYDVLGPEIVSSILSRIK